MAIPTNRDRHGFFHRFFDARSEDDMPVISEDGGGIIKLWRVKIFSDSGHRYARVWAYSGSTARKQVFARAFVNPGERVGGAVKIHECPCGKNAALRECSYAGVYCANCTRSKP